MGFKTYTVGEHALLGRIMKINKPCYWLLMVWIPIPTKSVEVLDSCCYGYEMRLFVLKPGISGLQFIEFCLLKSNKQLKWSFL